MDAKVVDAIVIEVERIIVADLGVHGRIDDLGVDGSAGGDGGSGHGGVS
jgi:hypothetical protein